MRDERRKRLLDQIFSHRAALQKYLRKFTAGAEDTEDLVQEAYVRVCALPDGQQVNSPRALLFRIARNLAVDRARQRLTRATDDVADFEPLNVSSEHAEIAQVLGLSHSTIEKHVAKGLVRCRDRLRELGLLEESEMAAGERPQRREVREREFR
jgi:DNA-directed RNA polymerase specialized sigma24 family protein